MSHNRTILCGRKDMGKKDPLVLVVIYYQALAPHTSLVVPSGVHEINDLAANRILWIAKLCYQGVKGVEFNEPNFLAPCFFKFSYISNKIEGKYSHNVELLILTLEWRVAPCPHCNALIYTKPSIKTYFSFNLNL